ncbi:MAG: amidase [Candidatus Binatia bacterium]
MKIRIPDRAEIVRTAERAGLEIGPADLDGAELFLPALFAGMELVTEAPAPPPPGDRAVRERPLAEADPCNAVVRRCRVRGSGTGALNGKRIGLKDNVALAGVPLTCGSSFFGHYVPDRDATIVSRMLAAGGEIVAILNMENLALTARGDHSAFGPVLNPHDRARLAGGSSGGSAAALFSEDIDLTIGGDQGGSIRIPASWCGVVGLKPTYGLVPYTGIIGVEPTIDHAGPMARTVADVALLLDVIAGADASDPRQRNVPTPPRYRDARATRLDGLRVGLLREGFGLAVSEPDVDEAVRVAGRDLAALGATVREVSVPLHPIAGMSLVPIMIEGAAQWLSGNHAGVGLSGHHDVALVQAVVAARRDRASDLPPNFRVILLAAQWLQEQYGGEVYARAQNRRPELVAAYDHVLADVDVLLMPTTPMTAPLAGPPRDALGLITGSSDAILNTAPFDVTGHPALSVPCGTSSGLPIGLMMVGRHFDEATLLRIASAYEHKRG